MMKSLTIADRLMEMMTAYESADHAKAQVLGKEIGHSMLQEAGVLREAHLIQPSKTIKTDRKNGSLKFEKGTYYRYFKRNK